MKNFIRWSSVFNLLISFPGPFISGFLLSSLLYDSSKECASNVFVYYEHEKCRATQIEIISLSLHLAFDVLFTIIHVSNTYHILQNGRHYPDIVVKTWAFLDLNNIFRLLVRDLSSPSSNRDKNRDPEPFEIVGGVGSTGFM